ncbi:2788_t:CDS:2, partial [Rhizophagus irregularis]
ENETVKHHEIRHSKDRENKQMKRSPETPDQHDVWLSREWNNTLKKFFADNNMDLGEVPEELKGLTEIEEMLIAQIFPIAL